MKRILACLVALTIGLSATCAWADSDPLGDLIAKVTRVLGEWRLKATLYHAGAGGVGNHDSLGCRVVAMRTAAVDGVSIRRRAILFIKETVGLPLPDGSRHDGYWYASDTGGAIRTGRIDLFTGEGAASMRPLMPLNLAVLTVTKVGDFDGCPPT